MFYKLSYTIQISWKIHDSSIQIFIMTSYEHTYATIADLRRNDDRHALLRHKRFSINTALSYVKRRRDYKVIISTKSWQLSRRRCSLITDIGARRSPAPRKLISLCLSSPFEKLLA